MLITIQIRTDNAAFEDTGGSEVARILRELAEQYDSDGLHIFVKLYDINGNAVGTVNVRED